MKYWQALLTALLFIPFNTFSQTQQQLNGYNPITTAVPFLMIEPDARGAGLGSSGVASSADPNSMFWNPASYSSIGSLGGFSLTFYPFVDFESESVYKIDDGYLKHASMFVRLSKRVVLASTFRKFSLGYITFTDENGNSLGDYKPKEYAYDAGLSIKLTNYLYFGISGRFIYSKLFAGQYVQGVELIAGTSFAGDIALFWERNVNSTTFSWGINISNVGQKISYQKSNITRDFIPANFRLGSRVSFDFNESNRLSFQFDFNKLLVPTPPWYMYDSNGNKVLVPGTDDEYVIEAGKNPNVSAIQGVLQSWYDAPGGFKEELQELSIGFGIEYLINNALYFRTGIHYENKYKGSRSYFTHGIGTRVNFFGFDFTHQIAFNSSPGFNYSKHALRFTILFCFGKVSKDDSNTKKE